MSVNEQPVVSREQGIYLDFASNTEENEEKPASSDGIGQDNKSFGKLAPLLFIKLA